MSDDAEQFFSAWISVFGSGPQKLLCAWHVDRAWRGHINVIEDKELAKKIYHNLRILLEETDEKKFESLLSATKDQLSNSPETKDFSAYFISYYAKRKHQWASCYRKYSGVNTNMYVEAFHRVLKHVYMKGNSNKRIDKCIHVLMKYERDKAFQRLIKVERGKTTGRLATIFKRHLASEKLALSSVTPIDGNTWRVRSSDEQREYIVVKELEECDQNCALRCDKCKICVHMYCCNCADALIRHTICKHIHLTVIVTTKNTQTVTQDDKNVEELSTENLLSAVQTDACDISTLKQNIMRKLSVLTAQVQLCYSIPALHAIESHIQTACKATSISSDLKRCFSTTTNCPANKKITPQRPFYSTKSKRKRPTIRLAKPTQKEKQNICVLLREKKLYNEEDMDTLPSEEISKYTACTCSIIIIIYACLLHVYAHNSLCMPAIIILSTV